jgi:hypothetical protein
LTNASAHVIHGNETGPAASGLRISSGK